LFADSMGFRTFLNQAISENTPHNRRTGELANR
jgi:hypothetical protein